MVLALLIEELRDECESAEDVEDDGHKAIPPTGLFSVDGTKVGTGCAVYLHRFMPRSHYVDNRQIYRLPEPAGQILPASRSR